MDFDLRTLSGLAYLDAVTTLLQRARCEHPTAGLWEASDFQWWWRKPRDTDSWDQLFWFDTSGSPVAAAVVTDWGRSLALDVIDLPSVDLVREVWQRGLATLDRVVSSVEVLVDDQDTLMASLLIGAGFALSPDGDSTAWMSAEARPKVSGLASGYSLRSRTDASGVRHHMVGRNGPQVGERLEQTSLYRNDLDLVVVDTTGEPVAYGLFWYDPSTNVGLVEPMRTEEAHQRRDSPGIS